MVRSNNSFLFFFVSVSSLSQGWIECVGCADRACYDLSVHTKAAGERLVAQVDLPQPVSLLLFLARVSLKCEYSCRFSASFLSGMVKQNNQLGLKFACYVEETKSQFCDLRVTHNSADGVF